MQTSSLGDSDSWDVIGGLVATWGPYFSSTDMSEEKWVFEVTSVKGREPF